jgi:hypothetical protein
MILWSMSPSCGDWVPFRILMCKGGRKKKKKSNRTAELNRTESKATEPN